MPWVACDPRERCSVGLGPTGNTCKLLTGFVGSANSELLHDPTRKTNNAMPTQLRVNGDNFCDLLPVFIPADLQLNLCKLHLVLQYVAGCVSLLVRYVVPATIFVFLLVYTTFKLYMAYIVFPSFPAKHFPRYFLARLDNMAATDQLQKKNSCNFEDHALGTYSVCCFCVLSKQENIVPQNSV